jgi:DNA topoisomerase-1
MRASVAENLVIVESPAKAKTIERYLGDAYTVLASYGHIRDLPRSNFAIEIDGDNCALVYEVPEASKKHVAALKKAAKQASTVWLAPDLDREGEAIAWHIAEVLNLDVAETNRVTFDEITPNAIAEAFASPRRLNTDLVDAQQARRAVDRIVGYRLSPVLWRTVASGISAGRVQSVALRIIVDREDEIRAFTPETYHSFPAVLAGQDKTTFKAHLARYENQKIATPKDVDSAAPARRDQLRVVADPAEAEQIVAAVKDGTFTVTEVRKSEQKRHPKPPFKTSTLQGEASKYGFSARQTMAIAQQLYEGVNLGGEQVGLITYMRTDSLNLSKQALDEIGTFVAKTFGGAYQIDKPRTFQTQAKGAQEAHEACRPTSVWRTPDSVRRYLSAEQARLYELIWQRTVATQMAPAVFDRVAADVVATDLASEPLLRVTGQVERFDGFLRAYRAVHDDDELDDEVSERLPEFHEGEALALVDIAAERHETSPPPRYSERTLVETLEEAGIGRPSTYASIISTLEQRNYVIKESRRFFPTPLGEVVVSFLSAHFHEIVDIGFTARMEETLDEIAAGDMSWGRTVSRFLDEVDLWVTERKPERPRLPMIVPSDCPLCQAPMERVFSGKSRQWFASCSRWPDCDGTLPLEDDGRVGEPEVEAPPDERVRCQICDKPMRLRRGRFGQFYGCVDYPGCKGIRNLQQRLMYRDANGDIQPFRSPTDPRAYLEQRTSRYGKPFVGSTGYPDDAFAVWSLPLATPCPTCGAPLRPPPKNRKLPRAVCTHPDVNHVFDLDDFDVPLVETWTVVDGVPALDPQLGGEALEVREPPAPISLTFVEAQDPPKKAPPKEKPAAKKPAAKKPAAKKTARKPATRTATRRSSS